MKFDTDQQLADWLGVGNKVLSAWKKRNSRKAVAIISSKCRDLDLNWVLTGEGEMLNPGESSKTGGLPGKPTVNEDHTTEWIGQKKAPQLTPGAEGLLDELRKKVATLPPDEQTDKMYKIFKDACQLVAEKETSND